MGLDWSSSGRLLDSAVFYFFFLIQILASAEVPPGAPGHVSDGQSDGPRFSLNHVLFEEVYLDLRVCLMPTCCSRGCDGQVLFETMPLEVSGTSDQVSKRFVQVTQSTREALQFYS